MTAHQWFCKVHGKVPGEEIRTVMVHGRTGHVEVITTGHTCGSVARRAPFTAAEGAPFTGTFKAAEAA